MKSFATKGVYIRMAMNNKIICSIAVACSFSLLTGCAASQDGQYRVGDMVNEVARAVLLPDYQPASSSTQAKATELGAYIKPMLEGCGSVDIEEMVKNQRSVVANIQQKGNPNVEGEDVTTTVTLKNAVAFGYPLQKIERLRGYEWGHTKLYFNTDKFVELRPAFKVPTYGRDFYQVVRNDANGYQYGDAPFAAKLTFDRQSRTVLCEY